MDTLSLPCPNCQLIGIARRSNKDNANRGKFWLKCLSCNIFSWFKEGPNGQLEKDTDANKAQLKAFVTSPEPIRTAKEIMEHICQIRAETAELAQKLAKLEARLDEFDRAAKRPKLNL